MSEGNPERKTGLARLLELAGTKKWLLILSVILAIIGAGCQFAPYVSTYNIMTELARCAANPSTIDRTLIMKWIKVALVGVLAYGLLLYGSTMCSHIAAFNILYELRIQLINKLSKISMGFFTKKTSGQIKKVLAEDVEKIETFVAHHIPDLSTALILPFLIIGYLYTIDWRLATVVVIIFISAMFIQSLSTCNSALKNQEEEFFNALADMNSGIIEFTRGIQVVKVFTQSNTAFEKLNKQIDNYTEVSPRLTRIFKPSYVIFLVVISSSLLPLVPLSIAFLQKASSYSQYVPVVINFLIIGGGLFFPLMKIMWIGSLFVRNLAGIEKIDSILDNAEQEHHLCQQQNLY